MVVMLTQKEFQDVQYGFKQEYNSSKLVCPLLHV
jgi:hypothetical protein